MPAQTFTYPTTPVFPMAYNAVTDTWSPSTAGGTGSGSVGTDRSITATTTSQTLMAANSSRVRFWVKNDSAVDVWINYGATATAVAGTGNFKIAANGGYYEDRGSTGVISIIAASATAAVTAREY